MRLARAKAWILVGGLALLGMACGGITVASAPVSEDTGVQPQGCTKDDECTSPGTCATASCDQASHTCKVTVKAGSCYIGGQCFQPTQTKPGDLCQLCDPNATSEAFVKKPCAAGTTCESTTGECKAPTTDVTQGDAVEDTSVPDTTPPKDDGPDTTPPPDVGPDTTDAGPATCTTKADCAGKLTLSPCQSAACAKGECVAVDLPEGSACKPAGETYALCHKGTCDAAGACTPEPLTNTACDDQNACTQGDLCDEGKCVGTLKLCDDQNPCTLDECDKASGTCKAVAVDESQAIPCDDQNACTEGDLCKGGQCQWTKNVCACTKDGDCADDGNACNGTPACLDLPGGGKGCGPKPGTLVKCDLANDTTCSKTACNPASGKCEAVAQVGFACDDADACTFGDKCNAAGTCKGNAQDCDDQNVCTADSCAAGSCKNEPTAGACSDGDPCTEGDACQAGACKGSPKLCDDGNACTKDFCEAGACKASGLSGQACDDKNACTTTDACACTGNVCSCTGKPIAPCNDNEACTDDSCDPAIGCKYTPKASGPCSDGNACTVGDGCQAGKCVAGAPANCTATGACKVADCVPATGCTEKNATDGAACDDGNTCTKDEKCAAGACTGGASICSCTTDANCDDGNPCNGKETCVSDGGGKSCKAGTAVVCAASNDPCKTNTCNTTTGVCGLINANEGKSCGPDDLCSTTKACAAGVCKGLAVKCGPKTCWTGTGCDPATGCTYTPAASGGTCDDGQKCTITDACDGKGACLGVPDLCDDSNTCTTDGCDPTTGCTHTKLSDGASCDVDGNLCTPDTCSSGACKTALAIKCSDGVTCTSDACDPKTGSCVFTPNDSACDDKNACTADTCAATGCTYANASELIGCADPVVGGSPSFCFQGQCLGALNNSASVVSLASPSCVATSIHLAGTSYSAPNFLVGVDYDGRYTSGVKCLVNGYQSVNVLRLSGVNTLSALYSPNRKGSLSAMAGRHAVGAGGQIGEVLTDGSKAYFTALEGAKIHDALSAAAFPKTNWDAVGYVRVGMKSSLTDYYLLAGDDGTNGVAGLCGYNATAGWACKTVSYNTKSLPATVARFASAVPYSDFALLSSTYGGGYLGSNSTDGNYDLVWHDEALSCIQQMAGSQSDGWRINGAVMAGSTAWHYGTMGRLFQCDPKGCTEHVGVIANQAGIDFRAAWAYSGHLVLAANDTGGGENAAVELVVLPSGSDPTSPKAWRKHIIEGLAKETDLEVVGSSTAGLYLLAVDTSATKVYIHSFLLPAGGTQ